MPQLYFIRHGQSTNNQLMEEEERRRYLVERDSDPDLTEKGFQQAKMVAEHLSQPVEKNGFDPQNRAGYGLTHLYTSLMLRSVKTGLEIAKRTNLPLVAWPEIHETGGVFDIEFKDDERVYFGRPGPGRSFFEREFPELILPDDLPEDGWWNRDKEPRETYHVRARSIYQSIQEQHGGKDDRVGIITHGGIFAQILTAMFDIRIENYWFLKNNCGISRIDIDDDGHVMLVYMNRVDFLPDDLVT